MAELIKIRKNHCLCQECIQNLRSGYPRPSDHYKPEDPSTLEKRLLKLRSRGRLKSLGSGRHRQTYLSPSGKTVIKFPLSYDGVLANKSERDFFLGKRPTSEIELAGIVPPKKENLAPCRMLGSGILLMIKVDTTGIDDKFLDYHAPKWAQSIDCGQVGWHPKEESKLLAFDYSG